jgi:uracil phosphoribosyltransferase
MRVHVANHPLITHKLTLLRDKKTDSPTFRYLTEELVTLLAYEATRDIRTDEVTIETPDEKTLQASTYANRLPEDLTGRQCYILDPMLATGGTLIAATRFLLDKGATDITIICILAAPEGVAALEKALDGAPVTVVMGALDERLNEHGYIVPGLGDAGDRLYGTV